MLRGQVAGTLRPTVDVAEARVLAEQSERIRNAAGGHDIHARIREMDRDGVAAEVIYHGTQDGNPVPFVGAGGFAAVTGNELQRSYEGLKIFNRWLADACSVAPERLIGCVHLPIWDVQESVRHLHWARQAGLRAVNFPAPRRGVAFYDDPVWEPFWSACEDLGMVLSTHAGFIDREDVATDGPHEVFLRMIEAGGWPARRAINRMVFGGVFERHPRLKLVLAEQSGDWWVSTVREFDSAYHSNGWQIRDQVPRLPSDYLRDNVFIGASFMAPFEAEAAVRDGYATNVMWGRDYPHLEGTWQAPIDDDDHENMTRLSLRHTYAAIEPAWVKAMMSDNGIRIYDLDPVELTTVAKEIGAPTLAELSQPLDTIPGPGRAGILSFRTKGPWG
jgi:predicted TIM-barrel fold metal-dependent hydrolase